MNKAQSFLINNNLSDFALTASGRQPYVYASEAMLEFTKYLEDELREARALLKEANDYLNINSMTNIGHGSILHTKFHELLHSEHQRHLYNI